MNTIDDKDINIILNYLNEQNNQTYWQLIKQNPFEFLKTTIHYLPTNMQLIFNEIISPVQRTSIPIIRKRRMNYSRSTEGKEMLSVSKGAHRDPLNFDQLSQDSKKSYMNATKDNEINWLNEQSFLSGSGKSNAGQVGKLANLLGEFEVDRRREQYRQSKLNYLKNDTSNQLLNPSEEEFEKGLLEMFLDGRDNVVNYSQIDFNEDYDYAVSNNNDELDEDLDQDRYFNDD